MRYRFLEPNLEYHFKFCYYNFIDYLPSTYSERVYLLDPYL